MTNRQIQICPACKKATEIVFIHGHGQCGFCGEGTLPNNHISQPSDADKEQDGSNNGGAFFSKFVG